MSSFYTVVRAVIKPNSLILTYPVIMMNDNTNKDTRSILLGNNPTREEDECLSEEKNIGKESPPTYME